MKNIKPISVYISLSMLIIVTGCENLASKQHNSFKTKEDSLNFAEAVIKNYPEIQQPMNVGFDAKMRAAAPPAFGGIDYSRALAKAQNYQKWPVIANINGFMLDNTLIDLIRSHPAYKKIYLGFGKLTDDPQERNDYTIMILPCKMNDSLVWRGTGSVGVANSNYDYVDPCPKVCPSNFN